jgi:hypothetical protein
LLSEHRFVSAAMLVAPGLRLFWRLPQADRRSLSQTGPTVRALHVTSLTPVRDDPPIRAGAAARARRPPRRRSGAGGPASAGATRPSRRRASAAPADHEPDEERVDATPNASANPIGRMIALSDRTKLPKTAVMMIAAAITTARPARSPGPLRSSRALRARTPRACPRRGRACSPSPGRRGFRRGSSAGS